MSTRGRSTSPHPLHDGDVDLDNGHGVEKSHIKVIQVSNLTRNVVDAHLRTVFGFYGHIVKIDLPIFGKSGQNRGKASLEFADSASAHKAISHMNGGQLDGAVLKVELSEFPGRPSTTSPKIPKLRARWNRVSWTFAFEELFRALEPLSHAFVLAEITLTVVVILAIFALLS
ncbi:hypothetical protein IEO21_02866 [Rhodonia placenta]|uniref:RRM domain-containing protein n=1 Tax=Rhodonia placenta TaxID=104341 RepID=A0A8H7P6Z5_9APHY|nr:hypothetical protein IEO21_02866 [Postia placenta]